MPTWVTAPFRFVASYWVAIGSLFFLLVLTFLGTLEQIDHGLFATQQKYFNSLFLIHDFDSIGISVPLPGVYLILIVFSVNLVCGALLRIPRALSHAGVWIVHLGILLLLAGGLVTFKFSRDGHLTLYETEQSDEFLSYYDWELAITEPSDTGEAKAYLIPGASFAYLESDESTTFQAQGLPFSVAISGFERNAAPRPAQPGSRADRVVDGVELAALPPDPEQERNIAGAYVTVRETATGTEHPGIVWGMSRAPLQVAIDGKAWTFELQRRRWQLPFNVYLDTFTRELHPGTNMPASFSSDITVNDENGTQKYHISMNKPLRYKGYTLFQASWGPQNARPGDRLFSTFAVVKNPADQWPLYACIIITLGLLVHFGYRLTLYLRRESELRA